MRKSEKLLQPLPQVSEVWTRVRHCAMWENFVSQLFQFFHWANSLSISLVSHLLRFSVGFHRTLLFRQVLVWVVFIPCFLSKFFLVLLLLLNTNIYLHCLTHYTFKKLQVNFSPSTHSPFRLFSFPDNEPALPNQWLGYSHSLPPCRFFKVDSTVKDIHI